MASPGNPNQPGGGPFDMNKFFTPPSGASSNPSSGGVSSATPSPAQNPNFVSYPPPTGAPAGGPYSYPLQPSHYHHQPPPPPPQFHHNHHLAPPDPSAQYPSNVHQQRSMSFPTPPLQPPLSGPLHHQFQNPQIPVSSNANTTAGGARLMALLSGPQPLQGDSSQQPAVSVAPIQPTVSGGSDFSASQNLALLNSAPNMGFPLPGPMRMPSSKLPKGRHLIGDNVLYDIDVRHPGEVQPQLEVTPITKYISDPGLVLGRQIAVNKTYICYGLKLGAIRVLNINTALRSLLKGLAQRVTDMAFFAEDVHLLASASVDGRVYVWKIAEGPDEEEKPQINGKIVIAVQFTGDGESVHPRVCWHCHKQEVLVVGIGRQVLKIDTTKVGKGESYSTEEPLRCPVDKLIDGIQLVGTHDGEITDLSMCQWMTTRLVSASADGTIKIWEDRKMLPIAVLRPHDGHPVSSVTFIAAPNRPDHIILITGGPLNKEVKIWASASEEGWLLPSDSEHWICKQKLELRSSTEARAEESFFNQVVALPQAGLLLLANAKKNAIYAVHLDFGSNPASTRMDYIAEFTVTMPILSFTGTSDLLPHGEQIVQVYCVQTQAIQQYALDLSQCLPPPMENDKSDSIPARDAVNYDGLASEAFENRVFEHRATEFPVSVSAPKVSQRDIVSDNAAAVTPKVSTGFTETVASKDYKAPGSESKTTSLPPITANVDMSSIPPPPLPLSPRLSRNLSGLRSPLKSLDPPGSSLSDRGDPKVIEYSVDRQIDAIHSTLSDVPPQDDESRNDDISPSLNHPVQFKHPTHLVTPSEILMATTSSEINHITEQKSESDLNVQDVNTDSRNLEVEVKVLGETKFGQNSDVGSHEDLHNFVPENKEKSFYSQASDLGIEMARESHALSPETYIMEESRQFDGTSSVAESPRQPSNTEQEVHESSKDIPTKVVDSGMPTVQQTPTSNSKSKKQKGKNNQGPGPASPSPFNSTDSSIEVGGCSSIPSLDSVSSQILAMQESINQLMSVQKDMQKQMNTMVTVPVTKEVKKLETALGKHTEKSVKANSDALWARFQEEQAKQEKSSRERTQQTVNLINNGLNKDLPAMVEKVVKKELGSVSQALTRTIAPTIEKAVSTAITEAFQKGVADKAVNQLEKSINAKLEPTVARQIQIQFQTSGRQALQETLKACLESSVIPAFEMACRSMFEQIDATLQKGLSEHATTSLQQVEPLANALRDTITSASSMTQSLSSELGQLADGHRKLLAVAVAGANSKSANPLASQLTNGPLAGLHEKLEAPVDPTKELSRLVAERKYEEAFNTALQRSDVSIVSWLCTQVDLPGILMMTPLPLSQGVLLSLLQQISCDISQDTMRKLGWMREVLGAIIPTDQMIAVHVRPIFDQVYQILNHHRSLPTTSAAEQNSIRLLLHVINSMMMGVK